MPALTAVTKTLCLLGHPVAHSVSPQIHNAAFAAAAIDAVYVAFDVAPNDLAETLRGLDALGMLGANVTLPHKRAAFELIIDRTDEAELVGSVNTVFRDGMTLVADNTDAAALLEVLRDDIGVEPGDRCVIFGSGGAARAAAVALGRCRAGVEVVARQAAAAEDVSRLARRAGAAVGAVGQRPRVVINATPLGLDGEPLPARFMGLGAGQVALDLTYGRRESPFLGAARANGAAAYGGLGMLVAQAAASFQRWTGHPAPLEVMAHAARNALGSMRPM